MSRFVVLTLAVFACVSSSRDSMGQTEGRRRDPYIQLSRPYVAPDIRARHDAFVENSILANMPASVTIGLGQVIRTRFPITRISIVDPKVVEVVQHGPREFEIMGRGPGVTSVLVWLGTNAQQTSVLSYFVVCDYGPINYGPRRSRFIETNDADRALSGEQYQRFQPAAGERSRQIETPAPKP